MFQVRTDDRTPYDTTRDEKEFWASLADLFMPEDDRHTYAEAMHRGNVMVSVFVSEAEADRAEDILEREGTIKRRRKHRKLAKGRMDGLRRAGRRVGRDARWRKVNPGCSGGRRAAAGGKAAGWRWQGQGPQLCRRNAGL